MRSPISWFGGKANLAEKIVPFIENTDHEAYVEVFGGGASVLFAKKKKSKVEVYNDIDEGLVNFFRVFRDPKQFKILYHLIKCTPYSRQEYNFCLKNWEKAKNPVTRAYRWFIVAHMSFSGRFGQGWSYGITSKKRNYLSMIQEFETIHKRCMDFQVENMSFDKLMLRYDTPTTLFYLDPPYIPETRKSGTYMHETTVEDHEKLVSYLVNDLKGQAILSGYRHKIYDSITDKNGWYCKDFNVICHTVLMSGKGSKREEQERVETLWLSPGVKEEKLYKPMF